MHSIWSGSINFGLVNIPVKLYAGSQSHSLDFNLLRESDLCPIKYLRVCKNDLQEVPYEEIVKGYKYADGEYVVLTEEDFENANLEQTHSIDILSFVDENEIDLRYFEKPYYLEPDRGGDKGYVLLRESLKRSGKVGIANFVLSHRGDLGILKQYDDLLVLNQIRYADEIRSFSELNLPKAKNIRDQEITLALTLISQLEEKFDPKKYKDTYTEDLKKIIQEKAKGIKLKPKGKERKPTKIIDLMAVLKKSLKEQENLKKKNTLKHKKATIIKYAGRI